MARRSAEAADEAALDAHISRIYAEPMDPRKPHWRFWVVRQDADEEQFVTPELGPKRYN